MLEAAAQCAAEVPDVLPLPAYQMQLNVRIVAVIDIPQRLIDLLDPSLNCFLMLFQTTVEHQEIADQVFVKVMFESFAMTWEVFIFDAVERGGEALGIVATNLHSLPELSELGEEIAHACDHLFGGFIDFALFVAHSALQALMSGVRELISVVQRK